MFITCQECNTTFRLDERLLKPTGSKVRCSQCRYIFVAVPPIEEPVTLAAAKAPVLEALTEEFSVPAVAEEPEDQALEGIDLAELDSILENETEAAAPVEAKRTQLEQELELPSDEEESELDEIDLDFDFDAALEAEDKGQQDKGSKAAGDETSDELSLDMDFEIHDDTLILKKEEIEGLELATLTLEEEPIKKPDKAPVKAKSTSEPTLEEDLDMAFKDLDLGEEDKATEKQASRKDEDKGGDNLDLMDFDLDMEGEASSEERGDEEMELSLADESEAALKAPPVMGKAATVEHKNKEGAPEDDLGLDLDLDMEPSSKESTHEEEKEELAFDLESDLGIETASKKTAVSEKGKGAAEDLEELSFELDSEFEEKPINAESKEAVGADEPAQDEGDIDLSDIEQMLEGEAVAAEKAKTAVAADKTMDLGIDDEIDLKDIESAIDKADEVVDAGPEVEDAELELDLDTAPLAAAQVPSAEMVSNKDQAAGEPLDLNLDLELELEGETPSEKASAGQADKAESELDLSDLSIGDLSEEKPVTSKAETVDAGDIELDFQIEEEESPVVSSKAKMGEGAVGRMAELPIERTVETKPIESKITKPPKPVAPKRKSSKIGIILLLLFLLAAAAAAGLYYAVVYMGIEVPYVSDYLKTKPKDPAGITSLTTMDINSKFIENSQSGRLFVITGKVRNGYGVRRNTIRLQGKLFTKGKVLVKTEFSYAGVQINDQELATLSIAEIKQALNSAPPALDATGNVQPGQTLPFMVVFSDLPPAEQLDEFAVELVSSLLGQ